MNSITAFLCVPPEFFYNCPVLTPCVVHTNGIQIIDDILDFTGKQDILGKPSLNDLKSGIATAPVRRYENDFLFIN